mgnify:CR=1 FL=1
MVMERVDFYGGFLACQGEKERRFVKTVETFDQKVGFGYLVPLKQEGLNVY